MKKNIALFTILMLLTVAFQNCGRPQEAQSADPSSMSEKPSVVAAIESPLVKKTVMLPVNGSRSLYVDSITLDPQSGSLEVLLADHRKELRKLPDDVVLALQDIFAQYELCGPAEAPREIMCSLMYVAPDAELVDPVSGDKRLLGNYQDPCFYDRVNFCDPAKADQLKSVMADVVSKFQSYPAY